MIATPNIVKDLSRLLFWYPCRWFILICPLPVVAWCGRAMGYVDYLFSGGRRRKRMAVNISRAMACSPQRAKIIMLHNLQNHLQNNLELIKYPQFNRFTIDRYASLTARHHLDNALAQGKGAILLTAHFGAKQFLQIALGIKAYRINQLNFHMDGRELTFGQRVAQKQRQRIEERMPVTFVPAKRFLRQAFECLKRNEILVIAGDGIGLRRHMDKSYQPHPFLGETMLFPASAISLAKRTGAPVIPVFVIREGAGHRICFQPAMYCHEGQEDLALTTYIGHLEQYIRQYPDHWEFWEEFDQENLLHDQGANSTDVQNS